MTGNLPARKPDAEDGAILNVANRGLVAAGMRQCRCCGSTKPDTLEFFYSRFGKPISRCLDCGLGGARPNSGGARRGAGRKPKAPASLPDESGHLLATVNVGEQLPMELPEGTMVCAGCRRILPLRRFTAPTGRGSWAPLAFCDNCRRRHRKEKEARDAEGRPREGRARWTASRPPPLGGKAGAKANTVESLTLTADFRENQQLTPCNLDALDDVLAPVIGPWPADYAALSSALYRTIGKQVEREGIETIEEGRQPRVRPHVHQGKVFVLEVPDYIDADLIHALPVFERPHEVLGDVVRMRKVAESEDIDAPPPGFMWFVPVKVPGVGRRLRLWDRTEWPGPDEMTDADWSKLVSAWNAGVDAGWGMFSQLNDEDAVDALLTGAPPSVLAQLKRTPALEAWLEAQTGAEYEEDADGTAPEQERGAVGWQPAFDFHLNGVNRRWRIAYGENDVRCLVTDAAGNPILDGWDLHCTDGTRLPVGER